MEQSKEKDKFMQTSTNMLQSRLYMTFINKNQNVNLQLKLKKEEETPKQQYFMPKIAKKYSKESKEKDNFNVLQNQICKVNNSSQQQKNGTYSSLQKPNRTTIIKAPIPEASQIYEDNNLSKSKTNIQIKTQNTKGKEKLKRIKNEDLTPFDFITMIRTDPDMQDEFCYLNKRKHPYDFKIVEFNERNPNEYMTISSRGITHYMKGVGEFIRIEDWEKEAKFFDKLRKIQFFKEYKIWKTFYIWKKGTRRNSMRKCQNILVKNLLLLDLHLQKPMIEIRDISQQMTTLQYMDTQLIEPIDSQEFQEKQNSYRNGQLQYQLLLIETQIRDILLESCKNSMSAFKMLHRIPSQEEDQKPLLIGDETKKDMPYTQEATIKTHFKRLRKYTRLVDYIYLNSKLSMIDYSTRQFTAQISEFNDILSAQLRSNTWLIIKLNVFNNELDFIPSKDQVEQIIYETNQKGIMTICERNKYFSHRDEIKVYLDLEVPSCEFMEIDQVFLQNSQIQKSLQNFQQINNKAVNVLQKYYDYVYPFMQIYKENIALKALPDQIDLDLFRSLIIKYQQQDSQLNVIDPKVEIGMFQIDAIKLKELIKNCALDCLQSIFNQIPEILISKTTNFLQIIIDLNHKLNWTISDSSNQFVEYFVTYCEYEARANDLMFDFREQQDNFNGLLALIQEFKIKITEKHKQKVQESNSNISQLKRKLEESAAQFDQNISKSAKKLERTVPELQQKIQNTDERLKNSCLNDKNQAINYIVNYLTELKNDLNEIEENTTKTNRFQKTLSFEVTNFEKVKEMQEQISIIDRLWQSRKQFYDFLASITNTHFLQLDFQQMEEFCSKMKKLSAQCIKDLESNEVSKIFRQEVMTFITYMDTLRPLLDTAIGDREWLKIRNASENWIQDDPFPFKNRFDAKYTFQYICEQGFTMLKDKYTEIALQATKEIELQKLITNLETFWKEALISTDLYKGQGDNYILHNNQDMINRLDDTILSLQNILASRFVENLRLRVTTQLKMFLHLQELLDEWQEHQNNFLYLEPILNTSTNQIGLQKESTQFKKAEKTWRQIMKRAKEYPQCKQWADETVNRTWLNNLRTNNKIFEQILKALDEYLEKKREHFQRFCFLSNIEILKILSSTKTVVQMIPHLSKLFENIADIQLDDDQTSGQVMISMEGEKINLKSCSMRGGEVEEWMRTVEESMHYSLKIATRQAIIGNENDDRIDWIQKHCCQVTLTVDSIFWTRMAEEQYLLPNVITEDDEYHPIDEFVLRIVLDLDDAITLIRQQISNVQRINLNALVTQDVHYRDVVQQMFEENIIKQSDFFWIQQMKFYWEDDQFYAKMVTTELSYGYEFLGSFTRLVITPLTDRCWMTITNAFSQKLGANPAGPAGTGKTESCKDLAKVLGRFCLVYNCSDQVNVKMMEKLFTGIASTGSWTCLDEFNRIDIEVLSVVSSQILQIREALLEEKSNFIFFGKQILLNQFMAIFITFNPGYAGRTELPENLKVLFRPISMMMPDYAMIAENMLYSEGFQQAREYAKKIQILYKLLSEQLSLQDHYDFGMRSIKSVLSKAANLKQQNRNLSDLTVLIKSIIDSNIPKFVPKDLPVFKAIIQDLFPGQNLSTASNQFLTQMIDFKLKEKNLSSNKDLMDGIMNIYETILVRFGIMLVGPSMSGKTTSLNILKESLQALYIQQKITPEIGKFNNIDSQTLNPKSITIDQLYGNFEPITQTWTDGLASKILRSFTTSVDESLQSWVIFDGPVDSFWVENMNSVLDDSMILCLSNGERIKLHSRMRIIFETNGLSQASPATISRCGMLYLGNHILKPDDLIQTYFNKQDLNEEVKEFFINYLKQIVPQILKYLKTLDEQIITSEQEQIKKVLTFIHILLNDQTYKKMLAIANEHNIRKAQTKILIYSVFWGFGSQLRDESQNKFIIYAATLFPQNDQTKNNILECFLDFRNRQEGEYVLFQDEIQPFVYKADKQYFDQIVPTKDTIRYQYMIQKFTENKSNLFITGSSGLGKTIIVSSAMLKIQKIFEIKMTFNTQTSSKFIQSNLEFKLTQQRKKGKMMLLQPPEKTLILMIDDINLPSPDLWGSHAPIELLRQIIDQNGIYDQQGLFFKEMEDLMCIAVGAPPGGSRSNLSNRFTRHFCILNIQKTSDEIIQSIFVQIVKGFFTTQGFKKEILDMTNSLVSSTLILYNTVCQQILPSAVKSHYIFSLRDVSKVFQGILMSKPQNFAIKKNMILLWAHESMRVFHDKLITFQDQEFIMTQVIQLSISYLNDKIENVLDIFFCDFLKKGLDQENKLYEPCQDINIVTEIIADIMKENSKQQLVLFKDAIRTIVRICRIIRMQRGHMVLVGMGGSGRRSLVSLACIVSEIKRFGIQVSKKYTLKEFRADIFEMMFQAGTGKKNVLFLLNEADIINEAFMEDINNLINSGEIIGLIGREEMDRISQALDEECRIKRIFNPLDIFNPNLLNNLHIVISLSPVGENLRNRFRKYTSMISSCNINWMQKWPNDALFSVSSLFLEDLKYQAMTPALKDNLSNLFVYVQETLNQNSIKFLNVMKRNVYCTSKNYLDFNRFYIVLLEKLRDNLTIQKNKLSSGLNKLSEANSTIIGLKQKLVELQPILIQKTHLIKELIQKLTQDQLQANQVKKLVESEANEINIQSEKIANLKNEADQVLKEAQPILQNAVEQLDKLNRGDISEIKQNNNPHALVKYTMECVAVLLDEKTEWEHIKKSILSDASLLSRLKNIKGENITTAIKEKLKKKLNANPLFVPSEMKAINLAAKSICEWVHAMNNFTDVYAEIQKKKNHCKQMDVELQKANQQLAQKQSELDGVIKKVQALEKQYSDSKAEKEFLDNEIKQTEERLHRASQLTEGLADEQVRWKEQVMLIVAEIDVILGNSFLSAASISYLGPFSGNFRDELLSLWIEKCKQFDIPHTQDFSLQKLMGNPVQIREWQQKGLSSDTISINNAILVQNSPSYPLIIDPQNQASRWIRNMEQENNLEQTKLTSENFQKQLQECVMLGRPILIEDIDEYLPTILDPILNKQYLMDNGKKMVVIGEETFLFHDNFRLFITTKLQNPHYLPEIFIKVLVMNFSVSKEGLFEKLLGDLLSYELPEDEKIRRELILNIAEDRLLLKKGEERILDLLTNSRGMILDDIELIESLKISKEIARAVSDKILVSEKKQEELNKGMIMYTGVAKRAVVIFFVIIELAKIDSMYQFSLNYFSNLFKNIITQEVEQENRIECLRQSITAKMFKNICRGLFNKDKKIFSFALAIQISLQETESFSQGEYQNFIQGVIVTKQEVKYPESATFSEKGWQQLDIMAKSNKEYQAILFHMQQYTTQWNQYFNSSNIIQQEVPIEIKSFQKLQLIKLFKFEKLVYAIDEFIKKNLGEQFMNPTPDSMDEVFKSTDFKTPLIFILNPGADPLVNIMRYAKEIKISNDNLFMISLGQGQGPVAEAAINSAIKSGGWVILQNCHLGKSFMPLLEKKLETFNQSEFVYELNSEFRLILTCMPCDYFPVSILQNGIKMTCEPPKGIKNNLLQIYGNFTEKDFQTKEDKQIDFKKLSFAISLFHSVILERRKFGSIGFNSYYQFNDSDHQAGLNSLKNLLEQFSYTPWDVLNYVIGQINYGGRVTDEWDRRLLSCMLKKFCNQSVLIDFNKWTLKCDSFYSPPVGSLQDYKQYIFALPDDDTTEIFGLHENANINFQNKESQSIIQTLLQLQPKESAIGKSDSTENEKIQNIIKEFQKKIPDILVMNPNFNYLDSIEVFLNLEVGRFNKLIRTITSSLKDILSAIRGESQMSLILEDLLNSLIISQVPKLWEKAGYISLKPLASWFDDMILRVQFMNQWITCGTPKSYWISAMFFPQGFLTGVQQNYARKQKLAIDKITIKYNVLPNNAPDKLLEGPLDGCYIHGLYSEGFRFEIMGNKVNLEQSIPGQIFSTCPIIHISPYQLVNNLDDKMFQIPIYKTIMRFGQTTTTGQSTNFIVALKLNISQIPDYWIMQGAALFCALDD